MKKFTKKFVLTASLMTAALCTGLMLHPAAAQNNLNTIYTQQAPIQEPSDAKVFTPAPGDKTVYSKTIPDLPLMQGMKEEPQKKDPNADMPPHAQAQGAAPQMQMPTSTTTQVQGNDKQVISYYRQALTQRGWKPTDNTMHSYTRDGQKIVIDTDYQNGHTIVKFRLAPDAPNNGLATPQSGGVKYNTPLRPKTNPQQMNGAVIAQPMRN